MTETNDVSNNCVVSDSSTASGDSSAGKDDDFDIDEIEGEAV